MKYEEGNDDVFLFIAITIAIVVILLLIWGTPVAPTPRVWIRP